MLDKLDIRDPQNGYFDVCYSPDDGGWYADLLFNTSFREPPICDREDEAEQWALHHGGKIRLRLSPFETRFEPLRREHDATRTNGRGN